MWSPTSKYVLKPFSLSLSLLPCTPLFTLLDLSKSESEGEGAGKTETNKGCGGGIGEKFLSSSSMLHLLHSGGQEEPTSFKSTDSQR